MNASFVSQEKADRMLQSSVAALQGVVMAMTTETSTEAFDELAQAARILIDSIGDARHLWAASSAEAVRNG